MATNEASKVVISLSKKYTQQSSGIWEAIRRLFAVDPNRSNGIPVKHYRNPPPGGLDPRTYDDPTTTPAADIADNPYWRRDVRRSYPRLSAVSQSDVVGLLSVGSAAKPSAKLQAGEEGGKQLVAAKQEGEKGLSAFFAQTGGIAGGDMGAGGVLGDGGLPPMPVTVGRRKGKEDSAYEVDEAQSYNDQYPCRNLY